jgi:hypothetical protein
VKGIKQLGYRSGNWLGLDKSSEVLNRAKRDYVMLALLLGCGLRRSELVDLEIDEVQTRQGHWAIVDLVSSGPHVFLVNPVPSNVSGCEQTVRSVPDRVSFVPLRMLQVPRPELNRCTTRECSA